MGHDCVILTGHYWNIIYEYIYLSIYIYIYPIYKLDDVFSVLAVCHFFSNIPTALKLY